MPAGAVKVYAEAAEALIEGLIDLDTDTFVVTLHTSSYSPAQNTHATWADVSASEVSGTGYTAGGVALSSVTSSSSGAVVTFDAADVSWPSSTITAKYAVITKRAGGSLVSGDRLLAYVDLDSGGGSVSSTAATFTIQWNASGIFTVTVS